MNKKILRYLIIAIVSALLGPLAINWLYQVEKPLIITEWGAVELLDYYGTILSAIISVLVILITITNEHEKIAIERREEKKRIEEQRHYDNIMEILDKVSDSIMESLLHLNPHRMYNLYSGYSIAYQCNSKWLLDLYNDGDKYLDRVDWLVNEYKRRIDGLSCYGVDDLKLEEIYSKFLKLQAAYLKTHRILLDIGKGLIESKAAFTSADFDDVYIKLAHVDGETNKIYESISSESSKAIQNIRIQIMQKMNDDLMHKRTPLS